MKNKVLHGFSIHLNKIFLALLILLSSLGVVFLLSNEIAEIKKALVLQQASINKLENEVNTLGVNPTKSIDIPLKSQETDLELTYTSSNSGYKNINSRLESMYLLKGNTVWTYAFDTEKAVSESERFLIVDNTSKEATFVVVYTSVSGLNATTNIFGSIPYSETEKKLVPGGFSGVNKIYYSDKNKIDGSMTQSSMIINSFMIFADNDLVIFNDFKSDDVSRKKAILNLIAKSNDSITPKVKLVAQQALK